MTVTYKQDGQVAIINNTSRVALMLGGVRFEETQAVVSVDVLGKLRKQNPTVSFIETMRQTQRVRQTI